MKKTFFKVILGLVFSIIFINPSVVYGANREQINEFNIRIEVSEDGIYTIHQRIEYQFNQPRHGIIATIPQVYQMNFDGHLRTFRFPVRNVRVYDFPFEVQSGNTLGIQIGDPNRYVQGIVVYEYSYEIVTRDLGLEDGRQFFYFNLVGDGWAVPIMHTTFEIVFPKDFEAEPLFYGVSIASTHGVLEEVAFTREGNTISGTYDRVINPGQALTILLDLPDGYFTFPDYTRTQMGIASVIAGATIILGGLFVKFGKDYPVIPVVTFYPPEGLSSMQVGYLADNILHGKDITSLFVYWASKGYLQIIELGNDKYEFIKLRDIPSSEYNVEQALFNGLFARSNKVLSDDIPMQYAQAKQMAQMNQGAYFTGNKSLHYSVSNQVRLISGVIFAVLVGLFVSFNMQNYFISSAVAPIGLGIGIILVVFVIGILYIAMKNRVLRSSANNFGITVFAAVLIFIIMAIYFGFLTFIGVDGIAILISGIAIIIGSFFILFMDKRSKYGTDLYGQILGLREFILQAKKDQLEMLVNENPSYFYDVLPYAYVLGVSDKWIKNFENIRIAQPQWYVSSYPMTNMIFLSNLNRSMAMMNNLQVRQPMQLNRSDINRRGGGGFYGGGSSGGFGGGFSGGGFGGGGGRSW